MKHWTERMETWARTREQDATGFPGRRVRACGSKELFLGHMPKIENFWLVVNVKVLKG
jgi:hypothetical protein